MFFCTLYSGSSGNSVFLSSKNSKILIDAGLPGKHIEKALDTLDETCENLDAIFVTHEHTDHIKGVGVLSRKYDIPIYSHPLTWEAMSRSIGNIKEHNIRFIEDDYVSINDMDILSYKISHDAACPHGYSVHSENSKFCLATDLGYFSDEVENALKDADAILLESNHDIEMVKFGPYPYPLKRRILSDIGHLSNDACGEAIVKLLKQGRKKIMLGHLSKTNNYPDLAYETIKSILNNNEIALDKDVELYMANRSMPSNYIEF